MTVGINAIIIPSQSQHHRIKPLPSNVHPLICVSNIIMSSSLTKEDVEANRINLFLHAESARALEGESKALSDAGAAGTTPLINSTRQFGNNSTLADNDQCIDEFIPYLTSLVSFVSSGANKLVQAMTLRHGWDGMVC